MGECAWGHKGCPPPLETLSQVFHTCLEGRLLELRTRGNRGQVGTVLPPHLPTRSSLLTDHSEPPAAGSEAQPVHAELLCQLGKGSLSSRHFTSTYQKIVIINIQIGHIYDVDPYRQCPCAVPNLHNLTWQSWLGWDIMDRPPAALAPALLP